MRPFAGLLTLLVVTLGLAGCAEEAGDGYADQMAGQHAHDTPEATGIASEPAVAVDTQRVQYGTVGGQAVTGYVAVPERPDSMLQAMGRAPSDTALPAVIVVHEWWGLNDNIETMTRRLAGEGFRALAVDLYGGQVAQTPDQARSIMQQATQNPDALTANIEAAYHYLVDEYGAPEVGIVGWCFGGAMALQGALALPDELDAAVIYYGRLVTDRDRLQALNMPVLGFFGGKDQSIPLSDVEAFETTLRELGKDVEVHVYDEAGHAFANPSGQNYVEEAARDAWDKTTAFLKEHLYGNGGA